MATDDAQCKVQFLLKRLIIVLLGVVGKWLLRCCNLLGLRLFDPDWSPLADCPAAMIPLCNRDRSFISFSYQPMNVEVALGG
jgi:hypothetical protein